jgi:hypothetical protein
MIWLLILLVILGSPSVAQMSDAEASKFLRDAIANELKCEGADHSHWLLRLDTSKPNTGENVDEVVETKDGELKYPIVVNGRSLDQQQRQQAEKRLQSLVTHPQDIHNSSKAESEDDSHGQRLLKMFPNAFIVHYAGTDGSLVQLHFTPNPKFDPPTREARVFHAMEGSIWLDQKQNRLARIKGQLTQEVKFFGGVLGYLHKGGQFEVTQNEVAPGYWELTALNVQMNGKALFFKTISVRQKYTRSEFKRVPDSLSAAQGLQMLRSTVQSENARLSH